MSDETPDIRELVLTGLGPEGSEARLALTEDKLVVETAEESPLPEWLRGEIPFDGLDVVYVDPAAEKKKAEEGEEEEESLAPGFRIARVIDVKNEETGESFPRTAALLLDGKHVDLEQAKVFAATFARLAGREKPEEPAAEEAVAEEPAEAPEAAAPEEPMPAEEPSAFAAPSDEGPAEPEDKAFV